MLEKIKLSKDWNLHKEGSVVEVDAVRAKWLRDNEYDSAKMKKSSVTVLKVRK